MNEMKAGSNCRLLLREQTDLGQVQGWCRQSIQFEFSCLFALDSNKLVNKDNQSVMDLVNIVQQINEIPCVLETNSSGSGLRGERPHCRAENSEYEDNNSLTAVGRSRLRTRPSLPLCYVIQLTVTV